MPDETEKLKKKLRKKPVKPEVAREFRGLSTGSTLVNLAMTGRTNIGFANGYFYLFVGDSNSGKTFLCLSALAEAANNPDYADYRLILDGPEYGAQMDLDRFFGQKMVARLEAPTEIDGKPVYSETVEEFFFNLDDAVETDRPFIYVLDSIDALDSEDATKKFRENKRTIRKGGVAKGSYGDGKAKYISANLRRYMTPLHDTGSILIIINQTRDNINAGMFEDPKTRSGGHALEFFAQVQLWSKVKRKLTREVGDKKRVIGRACKINVRRSRFTGEDSVEVTVPIYKSSGVDDVGGIIEWLIEEGHWKKAKADKKPGVLKIAKPRSTPGITPATRIEATEFGGVLSVDELIQKIEKENLESQLRLVVAQKWAEIQEACKVNRKKRYE